MWVLALVSLSRWQSLCVVPGRGQQWPLVLAWQLLSHLREPLPTPQRLRQRLPKQQQVQKGDLQLQKYCLEQVIRRDLDVMPQCMAARLRRSLECASLPKKVHKFLFKAGDLQAFDSYSEVLTGSTILAINPPVQFCLSAMRLANQHWT